ncbi:S-adenosyl-L-methionine-dependent methyltransferase [Phaeosphaeriaceae sp. PMI808]|nr:S-adenosyl-L-methionine-dependent methyltransferase [Phaeosphaeriaceae sp. PMI808]
MSTLAEANRKYFDSISDSYDTKPWFAKTNAQVIDTVRSRLDWVGIPFANTGHSNDVNEVRLLDYASGTGLMSRALGPYVTVTRGIDISPNMVTTFNTRMRDAGLSEDIVHAVNGDLFNKADPNPAKLAGPEWHGFDLATVGFGFHHFEDVVHSSRQLKERLRPGGVLVITDFLEGGDVQADENGNMIPDSEGNHAVHHSGQGHSHGHDHSHGDDGSHGHGHSHAHKHHHNHDVVEMSPELKKKMNSSIVVPHFTIEGVKAFFAEAGLVDIDVITVDEKSYMEFGGKKLWRQIFIAKGRRPAEEKSEL